MNPKLFKTMMITLVIITVAGIGSIAYIMFNSDKATGELSIEDMVEYSYTTEEMNTDLKDGSFVQIQFQLITDSKKAREEVINRQFQLKNIFIKESVNLTERDFQEGLAELETKLKNQMNELMDDGTIIDVYIISKIIQ
ncbi:flagellar basal body-associated protein FliL [Paraliobacillus sp. PM-2]|uniref:flagellar basal body-associated FliL family protein n=1 Tax=Paraliobacillus sp. PM-2 TaxID=1462524 RepID=UPI00061B9D5E|nr:flagellar basal body-associated FliL family protein [Paraliobacillus sp. PM-2]CQR47691.1 flagellar basal body-associated protein FliL [Paraliobacillus sp. PM-2]